MMRRLYRVLGSVEFLGNPLGVGRSIASGAYSFFHEPAKGAWRGVRVACGWPALLGEAVALH